jgi:GT2 family glycosyltransferase
MVQYAFWEVVVVDQSEDDSTRHVVEGIMPRLPNLRYVPLSMKGCSLGRNVGIEETQSEIIAFLDDDCAVESDWLTQGARAFDRHPRAELIVGELRRFDGLREWAHDGWIPIRHFDAEFESSAIGSLRQRFRIWGHLMGNGACMFIRRSLVEQVGFFDTQMGGGSRFPANEDGDYIYRALMAGCRIVGTPEIVADHYGLRDYPSGEASRLLHAYNYATAAWFMKVLRLGDPVALYWILTWIPTILVPIRPRNILMRRRPTGLAAAAAFMRGLLDSFALPVDRKSKLFTARADG